MIPLTHFLLGSWAGIGLSAWLITLPVALGLGIDVIAGILPAASLFAVRMVERGVKRSPIEALRGGG